MASTGKVWTQSKAARETLMGAAMDGDMAALSALLDLYQEAGDNPACLSEMFDYYYDAVRLLNNSSTEADGDMWSSEVDFVYESIVEALEIRGWQR